MVRNLTTLVLSGVLGSIVLVGNAEACLKADVRVRSPAPCKVACVQPTRLRNTCRRPPCLVRRRS